LKVKIDLSPYFDRYINTHTLKGIEISQERITVTDLLTSIKVPQGEIGFIIVNGIRRNKDYILQDGDKVTILPALIGG
jgi:sulfur carrier protein ThiS